MSIRVMLSLLVLPLLVVLVVVSPPSPDDARLRFPGQTVPFSFVLLLP